MAIHQPRWSRLTPLLAEALELEPERRAAWMAARRREDPELVAELESLLAREAELDRLGFMADSGRHSLPQRTMAGQKVGPYILVEPLGQGGMGSVWLARRTDGRFEAEVAIKFLNLSALDPVGEARFRREGTLLARLAHTNIARLSDAGVTDAGQPYLVLERVDGVPLDLYCDQQQLGPRQRIELFQQVLSAVAHAHTHFIVHRDLKRSNILVTRNGTAKLLDFGIAKLVQSEQDTLGRVTVSGAGRGAFTPECAAPEQVRGDPISAATDVYSLGVLLYQLLVGRHPTSEGCRDSAEYLRAIVDSEPARLSLGDLDSVLGKALRKNPAERYPTASALADDLDKYLRDEPVSARPNTVGYRTAKFVRRHRTGIAVALIAVAALLGATGFSVQQMLEARRERDQARQEARRANDALNTVRATQGDSLPVPSPR
jgi:serine/threonine protein kinase